MQVGDKVLISPNSTYYGYSAGSFNPKDTIGKLVKTRKNSHYKYEVRWENPDKDFNHYKEGDLILANNLALLLFSIDLKS